MPIIPATHSPVQSARLVRRPFAEGLLPPESDPGHVILAPWAVSLRLAMAREGYLELAREAAVSWVRSRGVVRGCPVVELEDVEALDAVVGRHLDPKPAARPTEARLDREPTGDDRRWLAENGLGAYLPTRVMIQWPVKPIGIRYEDTVSPADLDRMFSRDVDDMLNIGACG